jgi:hypothetical protein
VQQWIAELESARGRPADLCLAVGDVEAFLTADDHRRKAARRTMPAEFAEYADGSRALHRPLYFIAGNNEDFVTLHATPEGAEVGPGLFYLGRVGVRTLEDIRVGYLSGIHAPRFYDRPLEEPTNLERAKQAGYFRHDEVATLGRESKIDLMLVHEWPRGMVSRSRAVENGCTRELRAFKFPWIGNPVTRTLVDKMRPQWLLCGHSHTAFAVTIAHPGGGETRVACLDQSARADGAVFWMEWAGGRALRAGWGTSGVEAWKQGEPWNESRTPEEVARE